MPGLTMVGIRAQFAAAQAERAALRALIEEHTRLIAELRVRLAKVESVPAVKAHL